MEELVKKLDEIFKKYGVSEEEVAEVGALVSAVGQDELNQEGDDFEAPDMGGGNGDGEEDGE